MLKLGNYLHVKTIDIFLTIVFKASFLPYLRLIITSMKKNTLIKHKKIVVICEESGPISLSYNVILNRLEVNIVVKHVILTIIAKSTLTCTNCGKTNHSVETCHNRKKKVPIVPTIIVKSTECVTRTKTQIVKFGKITWLLSMYNLF